MAAEIKKSHFHRAALEIGHGGENDTLPYDIDAQFIKDKADELSEVCFRLFQSIDTKQRGQAAAFINGLTIGSERLLTPTGSYGFRITTRIQPFWNLFLNGLGIGIAEANEQRRSIRVHSYRLGKTPPAFFIRQNLGGHIRRQQSLIQLLTPQVQSLFKQTYQASTNEFIIID